MDHSNRSFPIDHLNSRIHTPEGLQINLAMPRVNCTSIQPYSHPRIATNEFTTLTCNLRNVLLSLTSEDMHLTTYVSFQSFRATSTSLIRQEVATQQETELQERLYRAVFIIHVPPLSIGRHVHWEAPEQHLSRLNTSGRQHARSEDEEAGWVAVADTGRWQFHLHGSRRCLSAWKVFGVSRL